MYLVRHLKRSTFETKSLHNGNSNVGHSNLFMGRPKLDISDLIDSNVDLFTYLIERIRLGTWKVRRLNLALGSLQRWRLLGGARALHFARVDKMWCASLGRQGRGRVYFLPPPPQLCSLSLTLTLLIVISTLHNFWYSIFEIKTVASSILWSALFRLKATSEVIWQKKCLYSKINFFDTSSVCVFCKLAYFLD